MSRIYKVSKLAIAAASLAFAGAVFAGPIIIAGTDADDHGSGNGITNSNGWKFMQQAFTNLGGNVTNGKNLVACIGCNGGTATNAFASAVDLAGLTGWARTTLTTVADITNFFNGTGGANINNTGIIYMPTVASNVGGGISDAQLAVVNANGIAINNFVAAGGGLFTQEQANSSIGYGWLTSLLPGLVVKGDNSGGVANSSTLQLTAQGNAQFPTLTDTDISNATPWHAYFTGSFGALQSLVVGNGDNVGGFNDAVVLGGGFAGGGGTIIGVPEPETLPLLLLAIGSLLLARPRRAS